MEIQIRNTRKEMLNSIPKDYYIAIGNEYCVDKFLYDCSNIDPSLSDRNLVLVTPRIPELSMERTINVILRLLESLNIWRMVINDYGLLYALSSRLEKDTQIIIGRTLSKNLNYCPWAENIMYQEDEEIKKNKYSSNLMHKSKVYLWKKYRVSGVEVCTDDLTEGFLMFMKEYKMEVFCHYDTVIASLGRVCHLKRLGNSANSNCVRSCTDKIHLKMKGAWNSYLSSSEPLSEVVRNDIPEFRCLGTAVYYLSTPYENKDINIIYDCLFNEDCINKIIKTKAVL